MPYIEGAHIGDMPTSSILRAFIIRQGDADWCELADSPALVQAGVTFIPENGGSAGVRLAKPNGATE